MYLERLKAARERFPLTQRELAARAGVTRGTIMALEAGTTRARPSTARALTGALGCEYSDLLERVEFPGCLNPRQGSRYDGILDEIEQLVAEVGR